MRFGILGLILGVALSAQGQTPLEEMVKTEQAFSKMAEEKNTREAFMTFIADDGLLFRPGAVNGKKWMLEHPEPAPPAGKKPLLAWQPNVAGMSASGDMGFTTGPWEAKGDIKDPKPVRYGHFVTVWKKQPDGTWRFVVDLGITHPQSGGPQTLWHPTEKVESTTSTVESAKALKALVDRDRMLSLATWEHSLGYAFQSFASPEIRVYRAGNLPYVGLTAATPALAKMTGKFKSQPIGGDVSRAGDFGYTHGTYEISDTAEKVVERGSYVRIWRKQGGAWRVVLDVTNVH